MEPEPQALHSTRIARFSDDAKVHGENYRVGDSLNDNHDTIRLSAPILATRGDESYQCPSIGESRKIMLFLTAKQAKSTFKILLNVKPYISLKAFGNSTHNISIFFTGNSCSTVGGPSPGENCMFPFKFSGNTYNKCTTAGNDPGDDTLWCSTKVDPSGNHVDSGGHYGTCGSNCPGVTEEPPSTEKPGSTAPTSTERPAWIVPGSPSGAGLDISNIVNDSPTVSRQKIKNILHHLFGSEEPR